VTSPLRSIRLKNHAPVTYPATILADSPIAYWRLNESAGATTVADSSGNSRTGTLVGTWTLGSAAKNGRLVTAGLAAVGAYWTVASSTAFQLTGDATWEWWQKLGATLTAGQQVFSHFCSVAGETAATNALYQIALRNTGGTHQIEWFHESGSGTNNSGVIPVTYVATDWNHFVVRRNVTSNVYEAFVNGVSFGTSGYTNDPSGGTSALYRYGSDAAAGGASTVAVTHDEAAIYGTALSNARIFEHYRAGRRAA
jgi:hypothetical protein